MSMPSDDRPSDKRPRLPKRTRLERQIIGPKPDVIGRGHLSFKERRAFLRVHRKRAEKSNPKNRNPDLKDAYSDPDAAWLMLHFLGARSTNWKKAVLDAKAFNCVLPGRDECRAFTKPGKDGQYMYAALPKNFHDKTPMWLTFGEVLAARCGYDIPDPKVQQSPTMLGLYSARVAVEAPNVIDDVEAPGVIEIDRTPLPLVTDDVLKKLHNHFEVIVITEMIAKFGLRLDLAKAFTPEPFRQAGEMLKYSEDFRFFFTGKLVMELVDETRRKALWKLLQEHEIIEMIQTTSTTFYRFGTAKTQRRYDGKKHREDARKSFLAMHPPRNAFTK
jgi:hypothetical protein